MMYYKQLLKHDPKNGIYGDCHRTALGCLLDLTPAEVPHFCGHAEEAKAAGRHHDWVLEQERWLNRKGYTAVDVLFGGSRGDCAREVLDFMAVRNPAAYYLMGGTSPRGYNHTVVCRGGEFEWDPHMEGGYLVSPMDHGYYELTFLLPVNMKAAGY